MMRQDILLFYSGILLSGLSLLFGMVMLVVLRIKRRQLDQKLDSEYGEREKRPRKNPAEHESV